MVKSYNLMMWLSKDTATRVLSTLIPTGMTPTAQTTGYGEMGGKHDFMESPSMDQKFQKLVDNLRQSIEDLENFTKTHKEYIVKIKDDVDIIVICGDFHTVVDGYMKREKTF